MADEKSIRAFLAIDPPEEILREIGRIRDRMKEMVQGDIRWVRPEGIHLTLKFFGSITETALAGISRVVEEHAAAVAPLNLVVTRLGVFPDLKRPRVVWLGTEGDVEKLMALQKKLEEDFQSLGFESEERPFRAHLTLGRIKTAKGLTGLAQAVADGREMAAGSFRARRLRLFRSDLMPQGAVYTVLAEYPFGGS